MFLAPLISLVISTAPAENPSLHGFPQYPSLSPQGTMTVFSAGGDLWSVPTGGGHAERLTAHEADEMRSAFSPDGKRLAFESNRDGATSIFLMPIEIRNNRVVPTGPLERLVVSDQPQVLSGFSADGQHVLFSGNREPSVFREHGMYQAPIDGGPVTALTAAKGESPRELDGVVVFSRGGAPLERPAYRGSSNHDVWQLDQTTGDFRRRTVHRGNDAEAFPVPGGDLIFISARDGQNNLYRLPRDGDENDVIQLTALAPSGDEVTIGHGIRDLAVSADGSTAVFAHWDQLERLDLDQPEIGPTTIDLRVGPDQSAPRQRRQRLNTQVREAARHPSGQAIAVAARGNLLVRSTDEDHPTHVITADSSRDQHIVWSPDGQRLYFTSDRSGQEGIWAATVSLARSDLEPTLADDPEETEETDGEADEVVVSEDDNPERETPSEDDEPSDPEALLDGEPAEEVSTNSEDDLEADEKIENETGEQWANALRFELTPVVVNDGANHHPMPSPDGRHLLYLRGRGDLYLRDLASGEDRLLREGWWPPTVRWASDSRHIVFDAMDLDFNSDIWIMDTTDPASAVNVTQHPDIDEDPRLSDDGKVLIFTSDRNQIGGRNEYDVYRVFLDARLEGLSDWERTEHFKETSKAAGKKKLIDLVDLSVEPEETSALEFEGLETAWRRADALTSFDGAETDLLIAPGGNRVMFSAEVDGEEGFYSVDAMGKDRKRVISGSPSDLRLSASGDTVSFVSGGSARTVPSSGGSVTKHDVDATAVIIISHEQGQKFDEAARLFGRWFYHPDLKGVDWPAVSARYRQLAERTRTPAEFNRVVRQLFGEVNGSHTGIYGGGGYSTSVDPIGYLGITTRPVPGGYEVVDVLDGSPADHAESRLTPGDVILSVNDIPLAPSADALPGQSVERAFNNTRGRETLLEVRPAEVNPEDPESSKLMLITPVSWSAWNRLAYDDEVRRNQSMVEEVSNGRLGYLHIRGMNLPSVHEFEHQLYAAAHGKDGLVIDVRNNGGGWTTDVLLTSLTAPVHASTIPRGVAWDDAPRDAYPRDRRLIYAWSKPIIVLANEHSYSNAEIFTHAIKNEGRGLVVGEETFGGVISTGAFSLVDGSRVRRPFRGWRLPDGTDMDEQGAVPDIRVLRDPNDEARGYDRQLDVAVEQLMAQLEMPSPGEANNP